MACSDAGVAETLQELLASERLRVYTNDDIVGVEFASLVASPRVTLAAEVGSVPEPAYWTHGAVLRQAGDNVSLRFHLTGLPLTEKVRLFPTRSTLIRCQPSFNSIWRRLERRSSDVTPMVLPP